MPEYDTQELARRLAAGESLTDIAAALDGPRSRETPEARAERDRVVIEGALHNDAGAASGEPTLPLGPDIMRAAATAGHYQRQMPSPNGPVDTFTRPSGGMSDEALNAGFSRLFERAIAGDDEAVYKRADESWGAAKARSDNRRR